MSFPPACALGEVGLKIDGRPILEAVSLQVGPMERVAILGPSGAGKTTLLRVLGASLAPSQGTVQVLDKNPWQLKSNHLRDLRSQIGFVPQDYALVPNLRVWQNVAAGRLGRTGGLSHLRRMTLPRAQELRDLHGVLEQVGMGDLLFATTSTLSGGEQQRVAIARSLYQEPALLLADEPVASVDPARAEQVMALLVRLADENRLPLVVSLHDVALAKRHTDRVIGLRGGRVLFDLPSKDLAAHKCEELYALPGQKETPR